MKEGRKQGQLPDCVLNKQETTGSFTVTEKMWKARGGVCGMIEFWAHGV